MDRLEPKIRTKQPFGQPNLIVGYAKKKKKVSKTKTNNDNNNTCTFETVIPTMIKTAD